jgi:hypothetical protein
MSSWNWKPHSAAPSSEAQYGYTRMLRHPGVAQSLLALHGPELSRGLCACVKPRHRSCCSRCCFLSSLLMSLLLLVRLLSAC